MNPNMTEAVKVNFCLVWLHREAIFLCACVSDYVVMGILEKTFLLFLPSRDGGRYRKVFLLSAASGGRDVVRLSIRPHKAIRATTAAAAAAAAAAAVVRILVFGTDGQDRNGFPQ